MDFLLFVLVCYYNSHYYFLFSSYQHLSFLFRVFNRILGGGAKKEEERNGQLPFRSQDSGHLQIRNRDAICTLYSACRLMCSVGRSREAFFFITQLPDANIQSQTWIPPLQGIDTKLGGEKKLEYICTAVQMVWYVRSQISSVQNQITHSSLERGGKNVSWAGFFSRIISVIFFFLALYSLLKP